MADVSESKVATLKGDDVYLSDILKALRASGQLNELILEGLNAMILPKAAEAEGITEWVENGGLLLRFAGPRLAASDVARTEEDPLMPVRLRSGGRSVGGAMSWGEPKALAPFLANSPFFGLNVPEDVRISAQVMAQPDPQ